MSTQGLQYDYQVAWLDLLHSQPRALLSLANHCAPVATQEQSPHTVPKLPFGLIKAWNMKLFNRIFFNSSRKKQKLSLLHFNNPLDQISHWNRLYGPKGLIQFQAVFDQNNAAETLSQLFKHIKRDGATPTLTVLKLLTQQGNGLLSFCRPGFTLAIDFINNDRAKTTIKALNQLTTKLGGQVYLAKDLLLNSDEFKLMYPKHVEFLHVLQDYQCPMNSLLAQRLGIK